MRALRELEPVESRILGGLRFIDATTGAAVEQVLQLTAPGALFTRNRSGLYVIRHWDALSAHETEFEAPPAAPLPGSRRLEIEVSDPSGRYLPVIAVIRLPRDPAGGADSLFEPQSVPLYPAPNAVVGNNWAIIRVSLTETHSGDALGGALLRVRSNGAILARALSDWRGEALVPVAGVPVTTFSEDAHAVVISEIAVTLEACFNPAAGTRTTTARVRAGRPPDRLPVVNPSALEDTFTTLPHAEQAVTIAARRSQSLPLKLELP